MFPTTPPLRSGGASDARGWTKEKFCGAEMVAEQVVVEFPPAKPEEREALLAFMRSELSDEWDAIQRVWGLSWPQFEQLYCTRGEVRAIRIGEITAGFCWLEHRQNTLHIHAFFVLPEQRGKGVGRAALLAIEKQVAHGAATLELGVKESNLIARRLYEQCGYISEDVVPELDYLIMRRRVSVGPTRP